MMRSLVKVVVCLLARSAANRAETPEEMSVLQEPAQPEVHTVYLPKQIQDGNTIVPLCQALGQDRYMITGGMAQVIAFKRTKSWPDDSPHAAQRGAVFTGQDLGDGWLSFRVTVGRTGWAEDADAPPAAEPAAESRAPSVVYLPKQIQDAQGTVTTLLQPDGQGKYTVIPLSGQNTIPFRRSKDWADESPEHAAQRGSTLAGQDEGDWVSFRIAFKAMDRAAGNAAAGNAATGNAAAGNAAGDPVVVVDPADAAGHAAGGNAGDDDDDGKNTVYLPKQWWGGALLLQQGHQEGYKVVPGGYDSIAFRASKAWTDESQHMARSGAIHQGYDEGDGWVRFEAGPDENKQSVYLPKNWWGGKLLHPQGQFYMITPGEYDSIAFRESKVWEDESKDHVATRGTILKGHDEGDGWVRFRAQV